MEDSGDVEVDYEKISQPGLDLKGTKKYSKVTKDVELIDIEEEGMPEPIPDPDVELVSVPETEQMPPQDSGIFSDQGSIIVS